MPEEQEWAPPPLHPPNSVHAVQLSPAESEQPDQVVRLTVVHTNVTLVADVRATVGELKHLLANLITVRPSPPWPRLHVLPMLSDHSMLKALTSDEMQGVAALDQMLIAASRRCCVRKGGATQRFDALPMLPPRRVTVNSSDETSCHLTVQHTAVTLSGKVPISLALLRRCLGAANDGALLHVAGEEPKQAGGGSGPKREGAEATSPGGTGAADDGTAST